MATESVAPAPVPTQEMVEIPRRDLLALQDQIDLLQLAVHGFIYGPEDYPVKALERAVNHLSSQVTLLVHEHRLPPCGWDR